MNRKLHLAFFMLIVAARVALAGSEAPAPIARWTFDEITAGKSHESANNGVAAEATEVTVTEGKIGKAIRFGSDKSRVTIPLDLNKAATAVVTVALWFRVDEKSSDYQQLFNAGGAKGLNLRIAYPGVVTLALAKKWHVIRPDDIRITPGKWTHVAASYDGTKAQLFVDGRLTGEASEEFQPKYGEVIEIGYRLSDPTKEEPTPNAIHVLKGEIDDLQIFNTALSPQQVQALCEAAR